MDWHILTGIRREYDDEDALRVLKHVAKAMKKTPESRMVINEVLTSSPVIVPPKDTAKPPSELIPEEQSQLADMANLVTLNTFMFFGGKERSFVEYRTLLEGAGLKITRFFPFRSFTSMIEASVA